MAIEKVLCTSPEVFRAALQRISPEKHPAQWAAEQLKLGVVLRSRARHEEGSKRVQTFLQAIEAFEAAFCIYCSCKVDRQKAPAKHTGEPHVFDLCVPDAGPDGVDLVVEAASGPYVSDPEQLKEAIELFRAGSSGDARATDFNSWLMNMINLGCTLTLLGKGALMESDALLLEEAVDTYQGLLDEKSLRDMPYECAVIYNNMAEALGALSEIALPNQRMQYLEDALSAMAISLGLIAPEGLKGLVKLEPIVIV